MIHNIFRQTTSERDEEGLTLKYAVIVMDNESEHPLFASFYIKRSISN